MQVLGGGGICMYGTALTHIFCRGYSFVACVSHFTNDHASLSRRSGGICVLFLAQRRRPGEFRASRLSGFFMCRMCGVVDYRMVR